MGLNSSRAFEGLEGMLVGRGVSRAYAGRYVGELRDHREDVVGEICEQGIGEEEAGRVAEGRIGGVEELAEAAVEKYRRGTLMGRHAWLFFGVMPVVMVPVVWCALMLAVFLPIAWTGVFDGGILPKFRWEIIGLIWLLQYVFPSVIGVWYYGAIRRRALGWGWRVGACAVAAVWGASLQYSLVFKGERGEFAHGMFSIGLGPPTRAMQWVVVVGVIVLYAWWVERKARRRLAVAG